MTNLQGKSNYLLNRSIFYNIDEACILTEMTDYMSLPHVTCGKLKVMGGGTGLNQLWYK